MTPVLNPQPIKTKAKAILPQSMVDFIKGCRYRGTVEHVDYLWSIKRNWTLYSKANVGISDSFVKMPNDSCVQIPPDIKEGFEREGWSYLDEVDEFITSMNLASDKKILWDIGAFFGLFSLAFALGREGHRAFAFEPNPISRAKFKECLKLNPTAKVEVFDSPVGLRGEAVEFSTGTFFTAAAGLSLRPDKKDMTQIETVSVDQLIEKNLEPPDFIKIDVEGLELDVLQGARKLLLQKKPLLSMELHPGLLHQRGTSAFAIAQYLEELGYVCYTAKVKRVKRAYLERRGNFRLFAM
jgi:FkbM family methyltransferase